MARSMRVGELAEEAGISVQLLRSYQSRGLVPPPRHEGRVAWYDERHLERLRVIADLKVRGYSLKMVAAALDRSPRREPTPFEAALDAAEESLTLNELAERSRVPPALLRSLESSGVLRPRRVPSGTGGPGKGRTVERYTTADVHAVRMLLVLLGSGLPMEEFMDVARAQLDNAQAVADGAVELFLRYGREPLVDAGLTQRAEAERMVAALRLMVHATTSLMTYNFSRMVLNAAQEAIQREGTRAERDALAREITRRRFELEGASAR